jgi:hypothetical protein
MAATLFVPTMILASASGSGLLYAFEQSTLPRTLNSGMRWTPQPVPKSLRAYLAFFS